MLRDSPRTGWDLSTPGSPPRRSVAGAASQPYPPIAAAQRPSTEISEDVEVTKPPRVLRRAGHHGARRRRRRGRRASEVLTVMLAF